MVVPVCGLWWEVGGGQCEVRVDGMMNGAAQAAGRSSAAAAAAPSFLFAHLLQNVPGELTNDSCC